jgi:hypothetical protein
MYRPGSVTRPASAQVILLTRCVANSLSAGRIKGIVVFHFIIAYMPHLIANPQPIRLP